MTTANVADYLKKLKDLDEDEQRAVVEAANSEGLDVSAEELREYHRRCAEVERGESEMQDADDVVAEMKARYS